MAGYRRSAFTVKLAEWNIHEYGFNGQALVWFLLTFEGSINSGVRKPKLSPTVNPSKRVTVVFITKMRCFCYKDHQSERKIAGNKMSHPVTAY